MCIDSLSARTGGTTVAAIMSRQKGLRYIRLHMTGKERKLKHVDLLESAISLFAYFSFSPTNHCFLYICVSWQTDNDDARIQTAPTPPTIAESINQSRLPNRTCFIVFQWNREICIEIKYEKVAGSKLTHSPQ